MKILMTTDAVGGVWHYAIELAQCLLNDRIEVVLVCTGPSPGRSQLNQVKKLQKIGLTFYDKPYRLEWMDDPWEDVGHANEWIKEIYTQEKPSDRKSTRLNSSHVRISYAVFCLKKK